MGSTVVALDPMPGQPRIATTYRSAGVVTGESRDPVDGTVLDAFVTTAGIHGVRPMPGLDLNGDGVSEMAALGTVPTGSGGGGGVIASGPQMSATDTYLLPSGCRSLNVCSFKSNTILR